MTESPFNSNDGDLAVLERDTVQQWVSTSFDRISERYPELDALIDQHQKTIASLVEKYCPVASSSCDELNNLERQLDGYFLLLQGDMMQGAEVNLIAAEMREYSGIVARIRRIFEEESKNAISQPSAPVVSAITEELPESNAVDETVVIPAETLQELLRSFMTDREDVMWAPTSKEALAAFKAPMGAPRIMSATDQFADGMQYLYLDLPRNGISDWSYLRHFRIGMEALVSQMEQALASGCEAYASAYRERCSQGMEAIEHMASEYELPEPTDAKGQFVWRSSFQKMCAEAQEKYSMDLSTEEQLREFADSYVGNLFTQARNQFFGKQAELYSRMPCRISQERYEEFDREIQGGVDEFEELLSVHVTPHLGEPLARKIRERYSRILLDIRYGMEEQLKQSGDDPDGLAVLIGEDQ